MHVNAPERGGIQEGHCGELDHCSGTGRHVRGIGGVDRQRMVVGRAVTNVVCYGTLGFYHSWFATLFLVFL